MCVCDCEDLGEYFPVVRTLIHGVLGHSKETSLIGKKKKNEGENCSVYRTCGVRHVRTHVQREGKTMMTRRKRTDVYHTPPLNLRFFLCTSILIVLVICVSCIRPYSSVEWALVQK